MTPLAVRSPGPTLTQEVEGQRIKPGKNKPETYSVWVCVRVAVLFRVASTAAWSFTNRARILFVVVAHGEARERMMAEAGGGGGKGGEDAGGYEDGAHSPVRAQWSASAGRRSGRWRPTDVSTRHVMPVLWPRMHRAPVLHLDFTRATCARTTILTPARVRTCFCAC